MNKPSLLPDPDCIPTYVDTDQEEFIEECSAHSFMRTRRIANPRSILDYQSVISLLRLEFERTGLQKKYNNLSTRIKNLEAAQTITVPITTLDPEPYSLIHQIPVVLTPEEDGYIATFFDADISINGDNKEEAVSNLRLLIVDMFEELESQEANLGPHPQRQLAVLRSFVRMKS